MKWSDAGTALLEALPVPVYITDADGRVTFYNEAAAEFWGQRPQLGVSQWCGSWRLFLPDGQPLPHDQCPLAVALLEGKDGDGSFEAIIERPDRTRVPFIPHPKLLRNDAGEVVGAINVLVDISERKHAEIEMARLAAIVSSSEDAIVSKTLEGRVESWNAAAARIFGYEAEEMIGEPITRIIPPELQEQETDILSRIRRAERVAPFDTVRITKDGRRIDISLTVSPVRDRAGNVVGASKVARDITHRKQSEELQRLLLAELNHRVKNSLAMIQAIATQSLSRSASPTDFMNSFTGRVQALARAHDLLVQEKMSGAGVSEIVREQVMLGEESARISCSGPAVRLGPQAAVQLALVLHELASNARKYGALSTPAGQLSITWNIDECDRPVLHMDWMESGVPDVTAPRSHGFGTTLIESTLQGSGGYAAIRYESDGLACAVALPLGARDQEGALRKAAAAGGEGSTSDREDSMLVLAGKRILLVEDEVLIAMETEAQLEAMGSEVVGPAPTIEAARLLIRAGDFDVALLDANLAGKPVHELAAALAQKRIPFAFVTGYGRDALPDGFADAPILTKPFSPASLRRTVLDLLGETTP